MALTLFIDRFEQGDDYTLSKVRLGEQELFGIEPPWKNNMPFESCIMDGIYQMRWRTSAKYPMDHLQFIGGTVGRTKRDLVEHAVTRYTCLVHPANWAHELEGCLAVGFDALNDDEGRMMVTNSRAALRSLMSHVIRLGQRDDLHAIVRWKL